MLPWRCAFYVALARNALPPRYLLLNCRTVGAAQERKAAVIRAEGESEAAKLISQATKEAGAGMIELRRIEAAKDIADKMARSRNVVYLPSGNQMLMGLGTGATG